MNKILLLMLPMLLLAGCGEHQDAKKAKADELIKKALTGTRTSVPTYEQILQERKEHKQ